MKKEFDYKARLIQVVKSCAKISKRFTDDQVAQIVDQFKDKPPKIAMKIMTQKLLSSYKDSSSDDFLKLMNEIFKLNDGSYSETQELIDEITKEKKKELNDNHEIVNSTLKEVCDKFNELSIDYYIVGALPVYLQTGKMLRVHEDIDFFVAEKDIPKVAQALSETKYEFHDNRLDSPRVLDENGKLICGDHEVVADRKDNPFHLGFFMFKREKDGSVTQREYHARINEKGNKIPVLFEMVIDKEMFEHNYGNQPIEYLGTKFRSSTPESVYNIKTHMLQKSYRDKDDFDVENWKQLKKNNGESLIDDKKLNEIKTLSKKTHIPPTSKDASFELIEKIKQQQEIMFIVEQNVGDNLNV